MGGTQICAELRRDKYCLGEIVLRVCVCVCVLLTEPWPSGTAVGRLYCLRAGKRDPG